MRPGTEVRPHKWSNVIDLFDNGWYSAIWGSYEESNERCLGVRWNGDNADDPKDITTAWDHFGIIDAGISIHYNKCNKKSK